MATASNFFHLTARPDAGDTVLFIYINFTVKQRDIQGYLAMLLDLPSSRYCRPCWTSISSARPAEPGNSSCRIPFPVTPSSTPSTAD